MEFVTNQLIEFGKKQLAAGCDLIAISDPSGTGEILGPKLFAEYAMPYINKLIAGLREASENAKIIVHICGKMHNVYEPLSQINSEAISFDAIVSLREAIQNLPGKAIMGNVSTYAIEFSDPEKVSQITQHCIKSGVSIVAPACGMGNNSPLVNMQAILQTVRQEGR